MALSQTVNAWKSKQPNGRIPLGELQAVPNTWDVDLQTNCHFMPEAARSFERMREDMADGGLVLKPSRSYRPLGVQQAKYQDYLAGGNLAAVPGTSNHGEALAGDMGFGTFTDPRYLWLKKHGAAYGWHQNDAPSEPWHWDYEGDYDKARFDFINEGDDMALEEFIDGQQACLTKYREKGADPGAPPSEKPQHFKQGWGLMRAALLNPKATATPAGPVPAHSHSGSVEVT